MLMAEDWQPPERRFRQSKAASIKLSQVPWSRGQPSSCARRKKILGMGMESVVSPHQTSTRTSHASLFSPFLLHVVSLLSSPPPHNPHPPFCLFVCFEGEGDVKGKQTNYFSPLQLSVPETLLLLQLFSQKNEQAQTCEVFVLSTASLCIHTFAPHFFLPLNVTGNLFYPALRCGKGFMWTQPTPTFFFSLSSFYPSGAGIFILLVVHFSRFPGSASVLLFTVWCECVMISI